MKRTVSVLFALSGIVVAAGVAGAAYLTTAYPDVPPPEPLRIEASPERLARGAYLFHNVAACAACHSTRDWSQYAAPVVPGTLGRGGDPFTPEVIPGLPGQFYAPNITPAALGDWSDGELMRAITAGVTRDGQALYPLMPYPHFGQLDREDIEAIVAYMRTLKPIDSEVPERSLRFPMQLVVRTLPRPAHYQNRPSPDDRVAYGGYLVRMAGCAQCHTPRDERGQLREDRMFAGGVEFHLPGGGVVRSPNITPDADTGIGTWSQVGFVTRFKVWEHAPSRILEPGERSRNTLMWWRAYSGMRREDLAAIYAYLRAQKPVINRVRKRDST